MFGEMLSCLL